MMEVIINGKTPKGTVLCIENEYYVVKSCRKLSKDRYKVKLILQSDLLIKD